MNLAINMIFVGLTVVFASLIILSFIISLFNVFGKKDNNKSGNAKNTDDEASVLQAEESQELVSSVDEISNESELVAVLTAAILASMGNKTECNIRVKSFRRIPQTSPVWNVVGRNEYIAGKL